MYILCLMCQKLRNWAPARSSAEEASSHAGSISWPIFDTLKKK